MAIHHATSGERIDIRPLAGELRNAITKTLYKSDHLEVFRLILMADKGMPPHSVPGEVTVQCLEGCIELTVGNAVQTLREGDMVCLKGNEVHSLKAVVDSSTLVTILLHVA
jgi:quercetin dioxygenase-like cupin family protein